MIIALTLAMALADEPHVVLPGDTVDHLAQLLGDPQLSDAIRQLNQLEPGTEPTVGSVVMLPAQNDHDVEGAALLSWSGELTLTPPGTRAPLPPAPGVLLPLGTTACTGPESFATISLAHSASLHDDLSLLPQTCVVIEAISVRATQRRSLVTLAKGSVTARNLSGDAAEDGQIAVQSASGLTSGTGGGFRVTLEEEAARTEAVEREVAVLGAGKLVEVPAGYGSRVSTGEAPQAPVKLLQAAQLLLPKAGAPLVQPDFSWEPVDRALAYRLQIGNDRDFASIQRSEDVAEPQWLPELLLLNVRTSGLWWRVSAFDRTGFEGFPSEPRALALPTGIAQ